MRSIVVLAMVAAMLAGCASQPQMTRQEYLNMVQRTYPGKTSDQVFDAAERLFRLADGNDFSFSYGESTMVAQRNWSFYLVFAAGFGVDTWTIATTPVPGGTKVTASVSTQTGNIMPAPTAGGDVSVGGTPALVGNVRGTAIYDVFWARMDYLLGASKNWMTCAEADHRVFTKVTWGVNEALCNSLNVKDDLPPEIEADPSLLPPQPKREAS